MCIYNTPVHIIFWKNIIIKMYPLFKIKQFITVPDWMSSTTENLASKQHAVSASVTSCDWLDWLTALLMVWIKMSNNLEVCVKVSPMRHEKLNHCTIHFNFKHHYLIITCSCTCMLKISKISAKESFTLNMWKECI